VRIPANLLVHTVQVQAYAGRNSAGELFGDPFPLRCMAQGGRKWVAGADGTKVMATLTLYADPNQAETIPPGSKVTHQGQTGTVVVSVNRDGGGLGTPDHTEVVVQ
jgi:hypothetical protein